MVKKKVEKPRRVPTKRQLSHWQREKKKQRITFIIGACIVSAALIVLGAGYYISDYQPRHEVVIKVNDTEYDMSYYIDIIKLSTGGEGIYYYYAVVDDVEQSIINNELIRQHAAKLGVTVDDSEIDEILEGSGSSGDDVVKDVVRTQLLLGKLNDEYFEHEVPVSAEQRHITAMFLESEKQASEVRARLQAGEDFAELAGELSLEGFTREKEGDLDWRTEDVLTLMLGSSTPVEYAFGSDAGVLSEPILDEETSKNLGYWFVKVLERKDTPEQAHVFVILAENEAKAQQVKEKLDAGENFGTVASEFSVHGESKDFDGDFGWVTVGMVTPAFDEFAFDYDIDLGTISEPIRDEDTATSGGYWLVKVLAVDEGREIEEDDRELLKAEAFRSWASSLWDAPENSVVASYMDDEQKRWAADKAYKELQ